MRSRQNGFRAGIKHEIGVESGREMARGKVIAKAGEVDMDCDRERDGVRAESWGLGTWKYPRRLLPLSDATSTGERSCKKNRADMCLRVGCSAAFVPVRDVDVSERCGRSYPIQ